MPTYIVKISNIKVSNKKKKIIAKGITQTHNKITGANSYFAQVIFEESEKNNHYMGGKTVKDKQVFLHGEIRSGRTAKIKGKLIKKLRDSITKNFKIKKGNVWVYLLDLPPEQMIEYGEILPRSGKETNWFNSLSKTLQKKLKKLDK
jgi:phenylpyruvate tautomerase PptA (4-oxalocrotonate tautomerase family)